MKLLERIGVSTIITPCASCGAAPKIYEELESRKPRFEVKDITEFLWEKRDLFRFISKLDITTYHDPYQLKQAQKI